MFKIDKIFDKLLYWKQSQRTCYKEQERTENVQKMTLMITDFLMR